MSVRSNSTVLRSPRAFERATFWKPMNMSTVEFDRTHFFMRILSFFALIACLTFARADETFKPETLASPIAEHFKTQIYARNVWDLKVFDGRLYAGTGNSSNVGPHTNAGPVPVFSMDLKSGEWKTEFTIDDEQIDVFRVLDGKLSIPGHDPRDDWSKGNFYQLEAAGWKKTRTIPNGIHTYDMAFFAGRLWGALGTQGNFQLASSNDDGQSWKTYATTMGRTYTLCEFEGRLLGWGTIPFAKASEQIAAIKGEKQRAGSLEWLRWLAYEVAPDETLSPRPDWTREALFPGAPTDETWAKLVRPVVFKNQLLYIGGATHNDHQADPFGAFAASSLRPEKIQTRALELNGEKPWDIEVHNDRAYILTSRKIARDNSKSGDAPDEYEISVWQSADAKTWTRALRFTHTTFARSFAINGRDFYFGLGTDIGPGWEKDRMPSYTRDLQPEAGTVLRVRLAP